MSQGYLSLVLHAHLPFVRHPDQEHMLEERWLFEAITETYLPLINVFEHLLNDRVPFRITMSMTPPLVNMLRDPLLMERYVRHLDQLILLSEMELERTGKEPHYHGLALMYYRKLREAREIFVDRYHGDIVEAFKEFQEVGCLEIITCGATHGFFPILNVKPQSVEAQVAIGADYYESVFGRRPLGIWLPECGYVRGVEKILEKADIKYFFTDTHGINHADPIPRYSVYAPLITPSGVAVFARDEESSRQVWSSKEGYPGDPDYREYYKDIGFECDFDYIKPFIHPDGIRINTGLKYWRITGASDYKEAYRPDWAQKKAAEHAQDFLNKRQGQVERLRHSMDRKPIIVAPYDAELYGHWWYEGPMFIDFLIRKIAFDQDSIQLATPGDYLGENKVNQLSLPSDSTWGYKGYNEFWLDDSNRWMYRHLHKATERMVRLTKKYEKVIRGDGKQEPLLRALNQTGRELLLAESSDWAFIMRTGTMVEYANRRVVEHLSVFNKFYEDLMRGKINMTLLKKCELNNNIFKDLDVATYYLEEERIVLNEDALSTETIDDFVLENKK